MARVSTTRTILFILLASSLTAASGSSGDAPNGIAAGDVTSSSAVLWARAEQATTVIFEYSPVVSGQASNWQTRNVVVVDPTIPAKVDVEGLVPGSEYAYRVSFDNGASFDTGTFRTAHLVGGHHGLRFGVSGDSRGELGPYPSIRNASERALDFFVMLGDTIYADVPSPAVPTVAETLAELRAKHDEVLSESLGLNTMADLRSTTAMFATIDDHEVTNDFAGGAHPSSDPRFSFTTEAFINETPLFLDGLAAFHEYYPLRVELNEISADPRTSEKTRLYRARHFGDDAALFVLDARSFRDEPLPGVSGFSDLLNLFSFLIGTFDPDRTMLGQEQLEQLKSDLLDAEQMGITWKFVMVPEPIQNLGVLVASDRFEGYAAERTEILSFIDDQNIKNVVFVAADLHGNLVNDLTYETAPLGQKTAVDAFEVVTGPVAYDAPLGPTAVDVATGAGIIGPALRNAYDNGNRFLKDLIVEILGNVQMGLFGYNPFGLNGSSIQAQLNLGRYVSTHVYGWTEFDIDATTQVLTVRVWGIEPYTESDLANDPGGVIARTPAVVTRFTVTPQ